MREDINIGRSACGPGDDHGLEAPPMPAGAPSESWLSEARAAMASSNAGAAKNAGQRAAGALLRDKGRFSDRVSSRPTVRTRDPNPSKDKRLSRDENSFTDRAAPPDPTPAIDTAPVREPELGRFQKTDAIRVERIPVLKLWACAVLALAMVATMLSATGTLRSEVTPGAISPHFEKRLALLKAAHQRLDTEITGAARYAPEEEDSQTPGLEYLLASVTPYRESDDPSRRPAAAAQHRFYSEAVHYPEVGMYTDRSMYNTNLDEAAEGRGYLAIADSVDAQIEAAQIRTDERRCLAEAMYYEAAFEPDLGQFAVADVVLNRVKSPLYPNSICAVIYQGALRETGCQFSFTCDGALERPRSETLFASIEKRAGAILAGIHMPVSKNATHYHADYVSPYWAASLEPTLQIGAHKFYKPKTGPARIRSAALLR